MTRGTSELLAEGTTVNMVQRKQQRSLHQQQQQQQQQQQSSQQNVRKSVSVMGSRRIFAPSFKLRVLDSYRHDIDCRGNQRATARKYGIHRRQIQKWLQCEENLRNSCAETNNSNSIVSTSSPPLSSSSPSSSSSSSSLSPTSTTTVISKNDVTLSTSEGVTMPGVTPAVPAPALNLGLARLHGDESAVRPPPPILPSRPPLIRDSPSSPRYTHSTSEIVLPATRATTTTTMTIGDGYAGPRDQQQRSRSHGEIENEQKPLQQQQVSALNERERTYYEWNNIEEQQRKLIFENNPHYDAVNGTKIYETLRTTCFRPNIRDLSYKLSEVAPSTIIISPATTATTPGSADSSSMDDGIAYCRPMTPSMVKIERSSPVTVAAWAETMPISPPKKGSRVGGVNDLFSASNNNTSNVVIESLYSDKSSSEFPIAKKSTSLTVLEEENNEEGKKQSSLLFDVKIKKEEEINEDEEESRLTGEYEIREKDPDLSSFFIDTRRPVQRTMFPADTRSPDDDQEEGTYSESGNISGTSSSGCCSDSEMESLTDYCQLNENRTTTSSSNDLTRRRSFSLQFKLCVLNAFYQDKLVRGNQRATARKFGINRRQVQKWLGQEDELRGEIALRGGKARQRLGPSQEQMNNSPVDFPVDLRTTNYSVKSIAEEECVDVKYVERSTPFYHQQVVPSQQQQIYCCEWASPSSSSLLSPSNNNRLTDLSSEIVSGESPRICSGYTCCTDASNSLCYQELRSSKVSSTYADSVNGLSFHCYLSPREYNEVIMSEELPIKRRQCTSTLCCYDEFLSNSPKRLRVDTNETPPPPPQEAPLCLVKQKRFLDFSPSLVEPVTSTVPTPPVSQQTPPQPQQPPPPLGPGLAPVPSTTTTTANRKDAILFKPYLDNPITKPSKETGVNHDPSHFGTNNHLLNYDNNNCQSLCNLNEDRSDYRHSYAIELNLKVPLSWRNQTSNTLHPDFHPIRSAFVRYPASSPHYI